MATDPGGPKRHALGVDFGTSNTVAVARWPDGRARTILVDGSPLLPSAVYAETGGTLAVGRDAVHSARLDPARFEPNPKRRIDDGLVLLGDQEFPVVDLIAGVLARVAEEWHRAVGPVLPEVTLTCPATWGATRRGLLAQAAAQAGLENARLVAEPVAAATYFAEVLGRDVPIGSVVVVHDFGAGTFDASVVARTGSGFEVMAVDGRDDIGGLDVDAAIVEHLRTDEWQRILDPTTVEERRARRQLWDDVRIAKERLSRAQAADFVVPLLDTEVHLTRDELEKLARPVLDQTVRVTKSLIDWADLPEGRLAGVFLVGGASRIPLVATLLHRELGEAPVVIEQPELVVAEGSILADAALLTTGAAAPGPTGELRLISNRRAERPAAWAGAPTGRAEKPHARADTSGAWTDMPGTRTDLPGVWDDAPGARAEALGARADLPGAWAEASGGWVATPATPATPDDADGPTVRADKPAGRHDPATARVAAAVPPRVPGTTGLQPPVDPWPDADPSAWLPDPNATVATPKPRFDGAPRVPSAPPAPQPRESRPMSPAMPPTRPVSPPPQTTTSRPVRVTRPPAAVAKPRPAKVAKRKPKRRGRFLRFLQVLLSIIVMITVPLVALVVAYGYGNGEPLTVDAENLMRDVAELLGI